MHLQIYYRAQSRIGLQIEPDKNDTTDPGFTSSAAMYDTAVQGPFFLFTPSNRPPLRYPAIHTRQPLPPHLIPAVRHKWEGAPMYFAASSVAVELNQTQLGTQPGYLGSCPIQPRLDPHCAGRKFLPLLPSRHQPAPRLSPTPTSTELITLYCITYTHNKGSELFIAHLTSVTTDVEAGCFWWTPTKNIEITTGVSK